MRNQIIAKAYAKAFTQLCLENKTNAADELTKIQEAINASNDLESVLFLDAFSVDEKLGLIKAISGRLEMHKLAINFLNFILEENRIQLFPLIYKEIVVLEDDRRGFMKGIIEGSEDQISPEVVENVKKYLEGRLEKKISLDYKKNSEITAGFKITVEDLQLDASLDNQLEKFKVTLFGE